MNRAPLLAQQLGDIQAMLGSGFRSLTDTGFWLLTIGDGQEDVARAWLAKVLRSGLMVTAEGALEGASDSPIHEVVAIAFSFSGLAKLGIRETSTRPFPTPFQSGMGSAMRESLLRDRPREQWRWSDVEGCAGRQTVHVLVANWRLPGATPQMPLPDKYAFCNITAVENHPRSFRDGKLYEPFGFRDGIGQPVIRGLRQEDGERPKRVRQDAGPLYEDRVIAAGEFVVGYRNEYDELTYCPDVEGFAQSGQAAHPGGGFALNGSYLAVRQIEQNVEAFTRLGEAIREKVIGRSCDGLPLSWKGDRQQVSDSEADAFRYLVEDLNGFICPIGAHIRRLNPRDSLGADVASGIKSSKLHRLLRRGRPYLEVTDDSRGPNQGMFFIACNADLERQFEFIHQRWMRSPRFGNLHRQDDPIVGSPRQPKPFSIPGMPSGDHISLEAFTTTLGGGYFFLPGIKALEFIARGEPGGAGNSHPTVSDGASRF